MSTSDINLKKESLKLGVITIFTIIFSAIYEHFSHGVVSKYMVFAFLIPLILGSFLYLLLDKLKMKILNVNIRIHNSFIITLLLGSLVMGTLEIYGTTNKLIIGYIYLSIALLLLNICLSIRKH